jgi:hypothetical protein
VKLVKNFELPTVAGPDYGFRGHGPVSKLGHDWYHVANPVSNRLRSNHSPLHSLFLKMGPAWEQRASIGGRAPRLCFKTRFTTEDGTKHPFRATHRTGDTQVRQKTQHQTRNFLLGLAFVVIILDKLESHGCHYASTRIYALVPGR